MKKAPSLAIIIPMYNEELGAKKCVNQILKTIKSINYPIQLVIVNDGSRDKTEKILLSQERIHKKNLKVVTYKRNRGYGGALQEGIRVACENKNEYGLFMDSDLTNDPKYIKDFVKTIPKNYDLVKASRYVRGGKNNTQLKRRFFSITASLISRNLFRMGIKDCTNGFRMVRLSMIKDVNFKENSFPIILEELYYLKKKKARTYEIPNILTARKNSTSHFHYNYATIWGYAKYALKASLII